MKCSPASSVRGSLPAIIAALFILLLGAVRADAEIRPDAGMVRYPALSEDHIAFVYAGDLWVVDRAGGMATPLASPPGTEARPRFSPDGRSLAFMGNYDGDADLFVIGVDGGSAHRVTHHPTNEVLLQWTSDDRLLFFAGTGVPRGNPQLYTVSAEGGLPERLPVEYGAMGAISADGRWLAFTPHTRDHRTWKRYRGGMATDLWLYDLKNGGARQITDWEGTDTEPMWNGQELYYLSDQGPEHRWNLWVFDPRTDERRQVTRFTDFDVKNPSVGPGGIVFQKGPGIRLYDFGTGKDREVRIQIPGDRPTLRSQRIDVSDWIYDSAPSATGKRALVEMRGDIWSVPAEKGVAVNLTRSSGSAERTPAWSPDGRWIAYFSDESGEYEIYVRQSDGKGEPRRIGKFGAPFRTHLGWSPDSGTLVYQDKSGAMFLVDLESGKRTQVAREHRGERIPYSWSHDSQWIAYANGTPNLQSAIHLYEVATGKTTQVSSGMFIDTSPVFDRKGDFLYYVSFRDFTGPRYEDVGSTFVYDGTEVLLMVPLRDDVDLPGLPEEDVEKWDDESGDDDADDAGDQEAEDDSGEDDEGEDDEGEDKEPLQIDLQGFESRAMPIGVKSGNFGRVAVTEGGSVVFVRNDGDSSIRIYDPSADKPEEKVVIDGFRGFEMTSDGKKLLVRKGKNFDMIDASADQKFDEPFSVAGLEAEIDPRAEWRQIFDDTWRMMRDYFYDEGMHGVDWAGVRRQYGKMLEECVSRPEVTYVIKEMISELNVGHAYHGGGDFEDEPRRNVGLLGVDFELHDGAYRIARVYEGAKWDSDARSPLRKASGDVGENDYILAVNGVALDTSVDPWAAFIGTADQVTRLTVSSKPTLDDEAREVLVTPLSWDSDLRYRDWIEEKRAHVEASTGGKVGYIYVPNTGVDGQNDLFRQFYGQRDRQALIIDERWNGGGQIPTRFIELLNRPITNYWAVRDGETRYFPWPYDSHQGPKCMLINGLAGSGGDAFPAYFRQAGLGKLIGERTWGGLVGISGGPSLVDGAYIRVPSFAYFDKDGTWGIEGHGVDPDIPVTADPGELARGVDPQLETAIRLMLQEIETNGYHPPTVPRGPNRAGMGLKKEDM